MKAMIVGIGAMLLLIVAQIGSAAEDKLQSLIPANADALIWVNVAKVASSDELKEALDSEMCKGIRVKLGAFTAITGIDPMKDIDYFCFFNAEGKVPAAESEVFALQGRFDENRLTQLIALNEDYSTTASGQLTIHQWFDAPDDPRCCVFMPDGIVMVAESVNALNQVLNPSAPPDAVSPALALRPAESGSAIAWATFPRLGHSDNVIRKWEAFHAKGINVILASNGETLSAKANVFFDTDANASEGLQIAEGIIAAGRLQDSADCLKNAALNAKASLGDRQNVVIETSTAAKEILGRIAEKACRH